MKSYNSNNPKVARAILFDSLPDNEVNMVELMRRQVEAESED